LLFVSFWLLTLAVAAGTILAMWHLRATEGSQRPPVAAGVLHGLAGAAGLVLFIPVLLGSPRGAAAGASSFGIMAGWLFAAALLTGIAVLLRRRNAGVVMAVHTGAAITGYILLLAWYSVG
jgi:hypothetical protein